MRVASKRSGVASVVGTLIFVLVFMLAFAAQAYIFSLQAQNSDAAQKAAQVTNLKSRESIATVPGGSGAVSTNDGSYTVVLNHLLVKYPNGTVYNFQVSGYLAPEGSVDLGSLVPASGCQLGTASCMSRYDQAVAGNPPGSAVGMVTALGNTFWFSSSSSGTISGGTVYSTSGSQSTSSTSFVALAGLAFSGLANSRYEVSVALGYYQTALTSPGVSFAVSTPSGVSLLACGGLNHPETIVTCTTSPNTSIGISVFPGNSVFPADYCNSSSQPCEYLATVTVTFGPTAGTLQLEFDVSGTTTGTVVPDSSITVALLS